MIRKWMVAVTALAALLGASPARAQESIDRTIPTARSGVVEVTNVSGNVRVVAWDQDRIQIQGRLGHGTERVDVSGDRNRTEIRVVLPRNARNVRGTDLVVRVPPGKEVNVRTTSADIRVEGITGAVRGQSTSGDVTITGSPASVDVRSTSGDVIANVGRTGSVRANTTSGDVRVSGTVAEFVSAESVSGDVDVSGSTPEVRVKTVSGDLRLRGVAGRASVNTVSGNASVRDSRLQYGAFETVSGDFRYDGELPARAAFSITSHSGNVELRIPANAAAEFNASTFSGSIQNQLGPAAERTSRYGPGQELRFTLGGGGGVVGIKTFSGNVRILRR